MKRQFSAGGLVYKNQDGVQHWLVRRPRGSGNYRGNLGWGWPKGWIDAGEKTEEAALREVGEEGGVKARIVGKLPTVKIFFTDENKDKIMKFISYFVMEFEKELPEGFGWETEEVKWMTAEQAGKELAFKSDKELLKKAEDVVLGAGSTIQSDNEK